MPIYEFKCDRCGEVVEKVISYDAIKEVDGSPCEKCDGTIARVPSVPALKFVGRDFYVTEKRREDEKKRIAGDVKLAKENIARQQRGEEIREK